jgi:flagellar assembly protein FliH
MSDMIAKEQLTAYQRWELPTFDLAKKDVGAAAALPTAAEVEQIHQQAYEEGYAAGAQKAHDEAQRLTKIIGVLDQALQQMDQQVAQNLLDLSMEIAKQILHQALKVKPELLLSVVNEAIGELPHFSQHVHLILHPSDAELVRSKMGEQLDHTGWKIFEDAQMERGGCRVETAHSQIDASLATRWKRVVSSIGQDNSWLEP